MTIEKQEEFEKLLVKKFMHYYDAGMNMWTIIPNDDAKTIIKLIAEYEKQTVPQERFIYYVNTINKIDDFFEYRYSTMTVVEIKRTVMRYIDDMTVKLKEKL